MNFLSKFILDLEVLGKFDPPFFYQIYLSLAIGKLHLLLKVMRYDQKVQNSH